MHDLVMYLVRMLGNIKGNVINFNTVLILVSIDEEGYDHIIKVRVSFKRANGKNGIN